MLTQCISELRCPLHHQQRDTYENNRETYSNYSIIGVHVNDTAMIKLYVSNNDCQYTTMEKTYCPFHDSMSWFLFNQVYFLISHLSFIIVWSVIWQLRKWTFGSKTINIYRNTVTIVHFSNDMTNIFILRCFQQHSFIL